MYTRTCCLPAKGLSASGRSKAISGDRPCASVAAVAAAFLPARLARRAPFSAAAKPTWWYVVGVFVVDSPVDSPVVVFGIVVVVVVVVVITVVVDNDYYFEGITAEKNLRAYTKVPTKKKRRKTSYIRNIYHT